MSHVVARSRLDRLRNSGPGDLGDGVLAEVLAHRLNVKDDFADDLFKSYGTRVYGQLTVAQLVAFFRHGGPRGLVTAGNLLSGRLILQLELDVDERVQDLDFGGTLDALDHLDSFLQRPRAGYSISSVLSAHRLELVFDILGSASPVLLAEHVVEECRDRLPRVAQLLLRVQQGTLLFSGPLSLVIIHIELTSAEVVNALNATIG